MGYIEELRALVGHRPLILVGAVVIIIDDEKNVLLQQRTFPNGVWGLPGGLMELGESVEETAKREIFEETGLQVQDLTLINVYSGPNHFVIAQNGDQFYTVTVAFYTQTPKGTLMIDQEESIQFQYFDPNQLPSLMVGSHRSILQDFLEKYYEKL